MSSVVESLDSPAGTIPPLFVSFAASKPLWIRRKVELAVRTKQTDRLHFIIPQEMESYHERMRGSNSSSSGSGGGGDRTSESTSSDAGGNVVDSDSTRETSSVTSPSQTDVQSPFSDRYAGEDHDHDMGEDELREDDTDMGNSDSEKLIPEEQVLIEELRIKAISLKKRLMERWNKKLVKEEADDLLHSDEPITKTHKGHKKLQEQAAKQKGTIHCSFSSCDWTFSSRTQTFKRHIYTHYPFAYFCPVCLEIVCREDSLDRHLQNKTKGQCVDSAGARRFRITRASDGRVRVNMNKKFFNLYYLGAMEEYDMPDEHFEIIAKRKRHAPLY
ncbi:hypothetical protein PNOK_0830600 [Pyrrhoderma noxium]|uniref:Uncharacterized protein n=1 Tax=Pyrrhoderma noxium TaxID=2282107 RepID=A0A286UAW3_9AGAM|nr:hypothetical protein PNOK_0830600 [Pyrrhoderma noxium]